MNQKTKDKKKPLSKEDIRKAGKIWAEYHVSVNKPKILKTPRGIKILSWPDNTARMILSKSKQKREEGYESLKLMLEQTERIQKQKKAKRKKRWNNILTKVGYKKKK